MHRVHAFLVAVCLAVAVSNCGGGGSPTPTTPSNPTPTTPSVTSVTVTGASGTANPGQTAQFTATANLSNSTTQNVTSQASWQSSSASIATVSASGMVTAIAAGEADIRATYQSITGSSRIAISAPPAPQRFSLCGTVRETGSNAPLQGAQVAIQSGSNAGRNIGSANDGGFCIVDLQAGTFTVRASRNDYESSDQSVNLTGNATATFSLRRISNPGPPAPPPPRGPTPVNGICQASDIPANGPCVGTGPLPPTAVCNDGKFSCAQNRQGSCSSHGGVLCWVCPGALCSGLTAPASRRLDYTPVTNVGSR